MLLKGFTSVNFGVPSPSLRFPHFDKMTNGRRSLLKIQKKWKFNQTELRVSILKEDEIRTMLLYQTITRKL